MGCIGQEGGVHSTRISNQGTSQRSKYGLKRQTFLFELFATSCICLRQI